ncbi:hypothetical protein NC653_024451 [Populus alba x Populus x berolinensis]|uniref:Uncharacterized protein n=1 Tax=Populus alba x Populus x berolinensis TaxID=444605 RepID=A0AAD6M8W8_9ROSI|nr:hypothetical protein NC653_024451 [Populus alba x Populus x berolinensis]
MRVKELLPQFVMLLTMLSTTYLILGFYRVVLHFDKVGNAKHLDTTNKINYHTRR